MAAGLYISSMPLVSTPAIVLSALRYRETSKIVRLATREFGVQSAIARGAYRPRSSFGAALQLLSEGQAHLVMHAHRELHTLTAFDVVRVPLGLAENLDRYAAANALAEVMLRLSPPDAQPEAFDLLRDGLAILEAAPSVAVDPLTLRLLWRLVSVLGFAPALESCARDGNPLPGSGTLYFSPADGGMLCPACARDRADAARLTAADRDDLIALVQPDRELPALDARHGAAHRRLLTRYIRHHLAEGAKLPALDFWQGRPWSQE